MKITNQKHIKKSKDKKYVVAHCYCAGICFACLVDARFIFLILSNSYA